MVRSVSSASVSALTPPTSVSARRRNAPTAPGTVGMHSSTSYMRRSRLNPITYSMCCQRPSSPLRLPTLVLPLTAPTRVVFERRDQVANGFGLEHRVAVDGHDDFSGAGVDTGVQGDRLALVGLPDHPDIGQAQGFDVRRGAVGRSVVDHDHFDVRIVALGERTHRGADADCFVVRGDDDRDRRRLCSAARHAGNAARGHAPARRGVARGGR